MPEVKQALAIIPARGGSKRLPGKNIRSLLGKPLIAWTIEQAKKSDLLLKVVVSTDSEEIVSVARKYGAEVPFLRPAEFARDNSPTINTVIHALDFFETHGEYFDAVALLEPTSPLRKNDDIDKAVQSLLDNWDRTDAVISVGEVHLENPWIMKKVENGYVAPLFVSDSYYTQRQQLPIAYFPYGVIYLAKTDILRKERTFYPSRIIPYIIERWQNYEIDDLYDFLCVEATMKYRREYHKEYGG